MMEFFAQVGIVVLVFTIACFLLTFVFSAYWTSKAKYEKETFTHRAQVITSMREGFSDEIIRKFLDSGRKEDKGRD